MAENNCNIQNFNFNSNQVRVLTIDNEPWFVAKDLCQVLEIKNIRQNLVKLDKDEKGVSNIYTPGGKQELSIVSESGMYALVLSSRKPEAKPFRKWVTSEVLPSIRKTGSYSIQQPQSLLDLFQITLDQLRKQEEEMLQLKVEQEKQKQELADQKLEIEANTMLAEANSDELERFKNGHGFWYSIIGYATKHGLANYSVKQAAAFGRKATALCKKQGIKPEKINDPRFGFVNSYPEHILAEVII